MVILEVNRTGYSVEQIENKCITVGEFISRLQEENPNEKICFSNDGGYTYGYINENSIDCI